MYDRHVGIYYLVNCIIFIGSTWLLLQVLNNHEVLSVALGTKLDADRVEEIIDFRVKMGWISLCLIPITLLMKYSFACFPFFVGAYVEDISLRSRDIIKGIVQFDFIFAIPILARYVNFTFLHPDYTLTEVQLCPFSLASLTGNSELPQYLLYPMQGINIFELVFTVLLIVHFKKFFPGPGHAALFICKYYVLPQLIWYSLVAFLSML